MNYVGFFYVFVILFFIKHLPNYVCMKITKQETRDVGTLPGENPYLGENPIKISSSNSFPKIILDSSPSTQTSSNHQVSLSFQQIRSRSSTLQLQNFDLCNTSTYAVVAALRLFCSFDLLQFRPTAAAELRPCNSKNFNLAIS